MYTILLNELRNKKGVTFRKLAADTMLSKSELVEISTGQRDPRLSTVVILAKYFGCGLDDLIKF